MAKTELPRFDEEARRKAESIVVTTCDINRPYEILGPVYVQISDVGWTSSFEKLQREYEQRLKNMENKGTSTKFSWRDSSTWAWQTQFERAFFIAIEELKLRAAIMDADAVIGMMQDIDLDTDEFTNFYLQMYGTAVKFSEQEDYNYEKKKLLE